MKIKLIYLAAGNSRRFNSQRMQNTEPPQSEAENKLLYLLDEKPMFRYLFDRLLKVCQRHPEWEMIVVTQYPEIEHQVKALQENEQQGERFPVKTVISKDSYKGAAYSVKAGIRAAEMLMPMHFLWRISLILQKKAWKDSWKRWSGRQKLYRDV